ncbi:MAG: hydroxymethylbilane synthase [Gammaproteobacteria bacterium RIFCSPHIGHO2_12_FULL_41_20]|nr:MAG: hydroxymethylbilane synthase [Gammaproteobacteria bacterium RIFCSPHIGHO2_12_FULL_41_20]
MLKSLTIATRESPLALWQAEWVRKQLVVLYPELVVHVLGIATRADKMLATSLREIGGKGLFVKELEEALLVGRADVAVHSMKDMPMVFHPELVVPVIGERQEVRDALVSNRYASWQTLPLHAVVGTSSLRRQSQLRHLRADLVMHDLRGNVGTRLAKLDKEEFDAIVVAGVGLTRLNLEQRIQGYFTTEQMLPAAGQGAIGIECHQDRHDIMQLIAPLNHVVTATCVAAERALCRHLDGNCRVPLAAYAVVQQGIIILRGMVANLDGSKMLQVQRQAALNQAEQLGLEVADELLRQGAREILREFLG